MAKEVRMSDIAQKLGISVVSVSKALSGKDGVGEEMRKRILETAEEMNYKKHTKSMNESGQSINIGVLVADRHFDENAFYSSLYRALINECVAFDYNCILEIVSYEYEDNCTMPTFLVNNKVDALIFMGELHSRYINAVLKCDLPYMLLDFYDDDIAGDSVLSDNTSGAYQITQNVLSSGIRNIAFVGSILATSSIMDRYLGYCRALLMEGIKIKSEWCLEDRDVEGKLISIKLPEQMPEAFVCNCDETAFNLVELLKTKGYRVPEDISVTGYDDFRYSTICRPALTSYRIDVKTMAKTVVKQLRRKMGGKSNLAPITIVPGELVLRDSVK